MNDFKAMVRILMSIRASENMPALNPQHDGPVRPSPL